MKNIITDEEFRYRQAKKKAREIRGFYINLICYCTAIPILIFVNVTFSPEFYWFFFSAFGWGFGLFSHWMHVFGKSSFFGVDWERKLTERMLAKSQRIQDQYNPDSRIYIKSSTVDRVKKVQGLYYHIAIFTFVNLLVFILQYFGRDTDDITEWFYFFPLIIWGIFLFFHAFDVYWSRIFLGKKWEDNKIRELAEKENVSKWE